MERVAKKKPPTTPAAPMAAPRLLEGRIMCVADTNIVETWGSGLDVVGGEVSI
jgi:hypothetical protein